MEVVWYILEVMRVIIPVLVLTSFIVMPICYIYYRESKEYIEKINKELLETIKDYRDNI